MLSSTICITILTRMIPHIMRMNRMTIMTMMSMDIMMKMNTIIMIVTNTTIMTNTDTRLESEDSEEISMDLVTMTHVM